MAIENFVSNGFRSTIVDSIKVFDCRLSGVVELRLEAKIHIVASYIHNWSKGKYDQEILQ